MNQKTDIAEKWKQFNNAFTLTETRDKFPNSKMNNLVYLFGRKILKISIDSFSKDPKHGLQLLNSQEKNGETDE